MSTQLNKNPSPIFRLLTQSIILSAISLIAFLASAPIMGITALFCDAPSCDSGFLHFHVTATFLGYLPLLGGQIFLLISQNKHPLLRLDTPFFILPALESISIIDRSFVLGISIPLVIYSFWIGAAIEILLLFYTLATWMTKSPKTLPSTEKTPVQGNTTLSPSVVTPLLDSILTNNPDAVRAALAAHPEHLNTAYEQNGNTPLHVAALNGYAEIVRLLLQQPGIDKTRKNKDEKTALDLAQEKNFTEIAELLK